MVIHELLLRSSYRSTFEIRFYLIEFFLIVRPIFGPNCSRQRKHNFHIYVQVGFLLSEIETGL